MHTALIRSAAVLALGVAAFGCKSGMMSGSAAKAEMMTVVSTADETMMKEAPMDGMYYLVTASGSRPMQSEALKKGDMVGFQKTADRRVMAMAGGKAFDVTGEKTLMWQHGMMK